MINGYDELRKHLGGTVSRYVSLTEPVAGEWEIDQDLNAPVARAHFRFRMNRFWSSPSKVPAIKIIANVLTDPHPDDIDQIVSFFGGAAITDVLQRLIDRQEISPTALELSRRFLLKRKTEKNEGASRGLLSHLKPDPGYSEEESLQGEIDKRNQSR